MFGQPLNVLNISFAWKAKFSILNALPDLLSILTAKFVISKPMLVIAMWLLKKLRQSLYWILKNLFVQKGKMPAPMEHVYQLHYSVTVIQVCLFTVLIRYTLTKNVKWALIKLRWNFLFMHIFNILFWKFFRLLWWKWWRLVWSAAWSQCCSNLVIFRLFFLDFIRTLIVFIKYPIFFSDYANCSLPDCFCSVDGTLVPGGLDPKDVPQLIYITFDDAINDENWKLYQVCAKKYKNLHKLCTTYLGSTIYVMAIFIKLIFIISGENFPRKIQKP